MRQRRLCNNLECAHEWDTNSEAPKIICDWCKCQTSTVLEERNSMMTITTFAGLAAAMKLKSARDSKA